MGHVQGGMAVDWSLLLTVLTDALVSGGVLHYPTGSGLQEVRLGVQSPGTAAGRTGLPVG